MTNKKLYTLIIFTEDKPGVLYRIADVFLKRKINITSLTVTNMENRAKFTIVFSTEKNITEKIVKQLYKIIEVIKVTENPEKKEVT